VVLAVAVVALAAAVIATVRRGRTSAAARA
jgi:hypothetical protein